jgi:hypothetical protein
VPSVEAQLDAARAYGSDDAEVAELAYRCRALLGEAENVPELTLLVVDYDRGAELRETPLVHTDSCKVILDPPTVLVSERFLLELEAAVRSFGLARPLLGCQYLRSDEELFALAHRVRADLPGLLTRLRRRGDKDAEDALTRTLLFFVAHEVGHLYEDADERSYATFIQADAPLETRVANAAMKLCRHVDEFARYNFDLPLWDDTADPESDVRLRERELTSTEELARVRARHVRFFGDEVAADEAGVRILVEHLAHLAEDDEAVAMRAAALTVDGLFAAGVFSWYRDLLTFGEKLGTQRPPDSRTLASKMLEGRETYVHAASLFGDEHRFTLLRAALAAEAIMRSRSDYFDRDDRTIWWTKPEPNGEPWWRRPPDAAWWEKQTLQRYWLLCILMDTAVKISYMGCTTAWVLEADRERGFDQLFFMTFESVASAVARLQQQLK